MIIGLDHIAIAVADFEAAIQRFLEDFGLTHAGNEDVHSAQTKTAFFPLPVRKSSSHPSPGWSRLMQKHLEKRGEGLHHICFKTDDVLGDMNRLKGKRLSV